MDRHTTAISLSIVAMLVAACTAGPAEPGADPATPAAGIAVVTGELAPHDDTSEALEDGLVSQLTRRVPRDAVKWAAAPWIHKVHLYIPQPE